MDFNLTEEQRAIRDAVRDMAEKEIRPKIMEWDNPGVFHHEVIPTMAELGLFGILFPESFGGAGLGYVEYVLILEELARVDPSVALTIAAHNSLCTNHIYLFGTDEQKNQYLPDLVSGKHIGAWALTEPGSGSDSAGMRTVAVRDGDSWILNGSKNFITHASVGKIAVVLAVTRPEDHHHGISAFIVDLDEPGVIRGKKEDKLGMRSSDTSQLHFEDCRIPADRLLGNENKGFQSAMAVLDGGRISIASLAVGLARGSFEHALKYSQERKQFNQPIFEFQAVHFPIADMATQIEAAHLLTMQAACLKDEGKRTTLESSMAKLYAGDVGVWVTEKAVQIFGGYGFIKDYPVEKYFRDVKLCTIGEGTAEIQRMVIARQLQKELG
ncbi:MAG TPA: acyl-CoA dehydrogenase family protein [Thermoanaerobaculia bacterium]|nr:acyl-CoA dehydrogenase family protein [Thermoanaerobaculia bacterium]HUM31016.1 acyl-CoA dehydrogenase family protein [Thermoanaerobaculia bacterium]HXK69314.1 acyl-CoA dehydrogenase family protein [Thermoanaerobaculia bacterium]